MGAVEVLLSEDQHDNAKHELGKQLVS